MMKIIAPQAEADEIFTIVSGLGFAKYIARKTFAARRHEIVAASFWPWFFALWALVAIAAAVLGLVFASRRWAGRR